MAPGDLTIHRTTHLPREKSLLIHYGLVETGNWIYSLCHCGYRGVCHNEWTIMIPNHQHPQHTDARAGQRLIVSRGGRQGIFVWNYGGIQGVSSEDFQSDHSYLLQLTVQKDCSSISGGNSGSSPSVSYKSGSASPTFTGKGGPIGPKRAPPKPPFGGGPPTPNPGCGVPPDEGWGGPGYGSVAPVVPRVLGPTSTIVPPINIPGGGEHLASPAVPVGIIRDIPTMVRPISLYSNINGLVQIRTRGLQYRSKDPRLPGGLNNFFGGPEGGGGFGGGSMLGSRGDPGEDDTEPDNWQDINLLGYHSPPESWLFGDGNEHAKEGDPDPHQAVANNVVDLAKYNEADKVTQTREHKPDGSREDNVGLNFPVITALPLRPGGQTDGLVLVGEEPSAISLDAISSSLGSDSLPSRVFAQEGPAPVSSYTVDSGENGETILVLGADQVVQGEKLNISSIFLPPVPDAVIPVTAILVATDSIGSSYTLKTTGTIEASFLSPAGITADIRTDKFSLGKLSITAIYRDNNKKTVGIKSETTTVLQAVAESSGDVIDSYTALQRHDISEGLRNLTQVGETAIDLILPQGGERSLLLVPLDPSLASNDASLVLSSKYVSTEEIGLIATIFDPATSSEADRIGTRLPNIFASPVDTQSVKKPGDIILKATGPVLVQGHPAFTNEHLLGHTPVNTLLDEVVLNIARFGLSDYGSVNLDLYLHKKLKLRATSRTALTRTGADVSVTYNTPFVTETVKLLIVGFRSDDLPDTVTFIDGITNVNGAVTFGTVTAQREHYISLVSYPYRLGKDEFYTELLDG